MLHITCRDMFIFIFQHTATPQHNGIAERMNQTLLEMARAMLHHGNIHASYWQDAVLTAAYIINRCVPSSLEAQGITCYEAWTGNKPSLAHMRVFGSNIFRHVLKSQRTSKVGTTSQPGVFIGYDEDIYGYYKIWDVREKKLYRTRDVDFMEQQFELASKPKHNTWKTTHDIPHDTSQTIDTTVDTNTIMYDLIYSKPSHNVRSREIEADDMEQKHNQRLQLQQQ